MPLWAAFAVANTALMYTVPGAETVWFHFVWVSTSLAYGLRPWAVPWMWFTCLVVTLMTGVPLLLHARAGSVDWQETSEIPLMALLFLVMVWHVRRRMAATAEATRLAGTESAARESQRRFVRFASHELRTPITVARGFTELLRSGPGEESDADDIDVVLDELDKLGVIASRLLALAQSDETLDCVEDVDLMALLERTARRWRAAAPRRCWTVECRDLRVRADPARLEAAIDSAVENAVRHTSDGGRIVLRGARNGAEVVMEVEDDGAGIAEAELSLVFDGFYSAGPFAGTGLGLAIVDAVAEAHHGRAWAASGGTGGTVISLALPA